MVWQSALCAAVNIPIDLWPNAWWKNCKIITTCNFCTQRFSFHCLLSYYLLSHTTAIEPADERNAVLSVLWTGCELGDISWENAVLRYCFWKPNISCWCSLTLKAFNWWLLLWSSHTKCNVFATCQWAISELLIKLSFPSLANSAMGHESRVLSDLSARQPTPFTVPCLQIHAVCTVQRNIRTQLLTDWWKNANDCLASLVKWQ